MLQRTFCHLPRIGTRSEQRLWEQGIISWKDFISADSIRGIGDTKKPALDRHLKAAQRALFEGESKYFCCLPSVEQWRLWEEFRDEACFIDIETNHRNNITVLGISDGVKSWQFVRHHNLDAELLRPVLKQFKLMVTFNGSSFDLPIIRRYFSDVLPNVPHIDLRHAAARAGLSGGLKRIEVEVGIARPEELDGVSGSDAIRLWHAYRHTGNKNFLDTLLQYNEEDIVNLRPLADIVYNRLLSQYP